MTDPRVILLRHGQTAWSATGRHTGNTDMPLTLDGESQAIAVAPVIAALNLRDPVVISSPRERATQTATLASPTIDHVWDDLAEWDYGDYEGLTTAEIRESVPQWTVWTHPCPHGESADSVRARVDTVLSAVTAQLPDRDVILVGHGHFSRAVIARWLGFPITEGRRFPFSPAALSVLGHEHHTPALVAHNLTAGSVH